MQILNNIFLFHIIYQTYEMRQACVPFECISNNDNPFCNIGAFIFKPLSKRRVPVLSIIAAQRDNITDHELIMRPKMCLTWYSFLIEGGKWKYIQKRISSFRHLNWIQNITFYDNILLLDLYFNYLYLLLFLFWLSNQN